MRLRSLVSGAFFSSALSATTVGQPSAAGSTSSFDGDRQRVCNLAFERR